MMRWPLHALREAWAPCLLLRKPLCCQKSYPRLSWGMMPLPWTRPKLLRALPKPAKVPLWTWAHSGLACAKAFGPGLEKALVSAKFGPPFKPNALAPSSDLGQGSPKCPLCLRKSAFAPTPCTVGTPRMEATTSPVAEISFPAETHSSQDKPSFPPNSSRGEYSSSSTPFWAMGTEREGGSFSGLVELSPREAEASLNSLSMISEMDRRWY